MSLQVLRAASYFRPTGMFAGMAMVSVCPIADRGGCLLELHCQALQQCKKPRDIPFRATTLTEKAKSQHIGQVSRAYRKHPYHVAVYGKDGVTQEVLGGWLGLTQAQISRIETGPPVRNLDSLCYWAQTLRIPPHLLGFKLPSAHRVSNGALVRSAPTSRGQPRAGAVVSSREALRLDRGSTRCLGVVSGCLLRLIREALDLTEDALAEGLALDTATATVQEWESGRRPLTALPAADLVRLRVRLIKFGAPHVVFDALGALCGL